MKTYKPIRYGYTTKDLENLSLAELRELERIGYIPTDNIEGQILP